MEWFHGMLLAMRGQTLLQEPGKSSQHNRVYTLSFAYMLMKESACSGEMVRTEQEINLAKANAFNFNTAINDVDKMKKWLDTYADVERVIKNLKDVILMTKYMDVANVNNIYHTQGTRVAAAFGTVETAIQAKWAATSTPYTSLGLQQSFLTFMRDYTTQVSAKIDDYLQIWLGNLDVFYQTELNQGGQTPAETVILNKIVAIAAEIATLTANTPLFNNPF